MKKCYNDKIFCGLKIFFLGIILLIFSELFVFPNSSSIKIVNGEIVRSYDELLCGLEQDPGNIGKVKYKPLLPENIQNDIQTLLATEEANKIKYYKSDMSSYILIEKEDILKNKIILNIFSCGETFSNKTTYIDNISIYKDNNRIIIYGESYGNRILSKSILNISGDFDELNELTDNYKIDLLGVDETFDNIISFTGNELTLVRKGNEFRFYRNSQIVGKPVFFPGKDIVEFSYDYILDKNNDIYYMYYESTLKEHWIKFVLVDKDIDFVIPDESVYNNSMLYVDSVTYPIYTKSGKFYFGAVDPRWHRRYGLLYGHKGEDIAKDNISVFVVDLLNIKSIVLIFGHDFYPSSDWYLRYKFLVGDNSFFYDQKIVGLDSNITNLIDTADFQRFINKEIQLEDVNEVIKNLKNMYEKYYNNDYLANKEIKFDDERAA